LLVGIVVGLGLLLVVAGVALRLSH
jgi:hypothetical protein